MFQQNVPCLKLNLDSFLVEVFLLDPFETGYMVLCVLVSFLKI